MELIPSPTTYRTTSGHTFAAASPQPFEVFSDGDLDNISAGQFAVDEAGNQFSILEIRLVAGRMYRITLQPG
ncbi:MAG: hypothetical protein H7Y05_10375 [Steroidobacteraceae bacterium]|nr:hypothetical protein [Deltaproteobacteria bacterium]